MQEITGRTRIFAILADPIHHVTTPQLMNQVFSSRGVDGVMVPFHVFPRHFKQMIRALRDLQNLDGFIVTVPHKTIMPALCDEVTPGAEQIGAVNAVRRTPEGRLLGGMLDGVGFIIALHREGIQIRGRSAYVMGAGGAGSAVAFALAEAGVARLTIANRTSEKANELVDRIASRFPKLALAIGTRDPSGQDIVVNATSLGLYAADPLPLDVERLEPAQIVVEAIVQPAETPLLAAAKIRGCRVQYGLAMLVCQIELMADFMGAVDSRSATESRNG
jgi:shikimate dehydrogenase